MISRHHIQLTTLTILPLSMHLRITNSISLKDFFLVTIMSLFGSLLPDLDIGKKSYLYKKYPSISNFAINSIQRTHKLLKIAQKNNGHRGLYHSLLGIFLSSISISFIVFLFSFSFEVSYKYFWLTIFSLFISQVLHLLQDSLTPTGIAWLYPWKETRLKGNISTFNTDKNKKYRYDIRPDFYTAILGIYTAYLFFYVKIEYMISHKTGYLFQILFTLILFWVIFITVAKKTSNNWIRKGIFKK